MSKLSYSVSEQVEIPSWETITTNNYFFRKSWERFLTNIIRVSNKPNIISRRYSSRIKKQGKKTKRLHQGGSRTK